MQIRITENSYNDKTWQVEIQIQNTKYFVTLPKPIGEQVNTNEKELEWYFESYISDSYSVAPTRVENAKQLVKTYGDELFTNLFKSNSDLYKVYQYLWYENKIENFEFYICSDTPEFHALHWEMLYDSEIKKHFAKEGAIFIRQNTTFKQSQLKLQPSSCINLLIVTSRPNWDDDVNHRIIQRPLIDLIENESLNVNAHILRPGTYHELYKHLKDKKGFYHIIHFDIHGGLLSFREIVQKNTENSQSVYVYAIKNRHENLPDITKYEGKRSYLLFETEKKGKPMPVESTEIANLLSEAHIPLCILNACQSAKQSSDEVHTSLGYHIMQSGVPMVLAMSYSLSVTAAEVLMKNLYDLLFKTSNPDKSFAISRSKMSRNNKRKAFLNFTIELEDWVLPVVYKSQDVNLNLYLSNTQISQKKIITNEINYKEPTYGFHGRDIEILQIEKMLLNHNHLLIQSMGGAGKTTLIKYLSLWWQRTNFIDKVFAFEYDKEKYFAQTIIDKIAQTVLPAHILNTWLSRTKEEQADFVLNALNATNHLLIFDNLESVTGEKLSIVNLLDKEQQTELATFLNRITGKTKVLYGSRNSVDWLAKQTFNNHVYLLNGFDMDTRYDFAKKILETIQLPKKQAGEHLRLFENVDFKRLMDLLGGSPLAMQAILPILKTKTPDEILNDLQSGVQLQSENITDKTQSILHCIEYSYNNLSPQAQQLLLLLAPFQSYITFLRIEAYFEELQKIETFNSYPYHQLKEVIFEAVQNGFMQLEDKDFEIYHLQPVFSYFLRSILQQTNNPIFIHDLHTVFVEYYKRMGIDCRELLTSQNAQERQVGIFLTHHEYENLHTALEICLEHKEQFWDNLFVPIRYFLDLNNRHQERLQLTLWAKKCMEQFPVAMLSYALGFDYNGVLNEIGTIYFNISQFSLAKQAFLEGIKFYENYPLRDEKQFAIMYQNIGETCLYLEQFDEVLQCNQKARLIYEKLGDKASVAETYLNFGNLFFRQEKYDESKASYLQAVDMFVALKQGHSVGMTYHNLGNVCQKLKEYNESTEYYQKALAIYQQFVDTAREANTYLSLGVLMLVTQNYIDSIEFYQQALVAYIRLEDTYHQAVIYEGLGCVFMNLDKSKYVEAKDYYHKAWEIFKGYNDEYQMNHVLYNVRLLASAWGKPEIVREFV